MSSQITPTEPSRHASHASPACHAKTEAAFRAPPKLKLFGQAALFVGIVVALLFAGRLAEDSAFPRIFWGRLALLTLAGLWIGLLATALTAALRRAFSGFAPLLPASGLIATAFAGYGLFWVYLWQPLLGHALVLGAGIAALTWLASPAGKSGRALWSDPSWCAPLFTMAALGFLYFGLLHLWPHEGEWNWLAAHRFAHELPMDNLLPQLLSERLLTGKPLEPFIGDWLSSDRPPLQAAWVLLAGPLALCGKSGAFYEALGQAFGLWFQLLWWPVLAAFFQSLGFSLRKSLMTALPLAFTAFLFTNSAYAWPKLAASAFVLTAWLELRAPQNEGHDSKPHTGSWLRAGACLALACLSHGGAAFPIIALALVIAIRQRPFDRRAMLHFGALLAAVLLIFAPWFAYQRLGAPPGNRLVKWHLAGVVAIDQRSSIETLRDAYAGISAEQWIRGKIDNLNALYEGEWKNLAMLSEANLDRRRADDFFLLLRSIGWWNVGLVLLIPVAWLRWNSSDPAMVHEIMSVLGWIILTLFFWVLLMFVPYSTAIHQGSYLPPLLLLALSAWALQRLHALAFGLVACLSGWYWLDTYILHAPKDFSLPVLSAATGLACLAALALICAPLRVKAHDDRK